MFKLSTQRKLNKERKNYLNYVRYRLVNSARIPVNAFAFDSQGNVGQGESPNVESYGALVSDLVSGQSGTTEDVLTLLSIMANILLVKEEDHDDDDEFA